MSSPAAPTLAPLPSEQLPTVLLLVADEAARGRRGILHHVRDALAAMRVDAADVGDHHGLATRELSGSDAVLVVGDDPAVRATVATIVERPVDERPSVGIVGSERNSFVRTFGLDRGPFVAIQHAVSGTLMAIDVMHLDIAGDPAVAVNMVEVGWGAALLAEREDRPERLRHRVRAARSLDATNPVTVTIDHTTFTEPLSRVITANGQFLGDEGRVSPRALPDDGRLNVQSWGLFDEQLVVGPAGLHVGEHLGNEHIREHQTTGITITSPTPLPVSADGTVLGTTPVSITVEQHALRLHV